MNIKNILIVSHYRCNFNCVYCNQQDFLRKHITEKLEIKDIIPFINFIDKNNQSKNINIQFEGGETLIYWKTFIKPLIEYIKNNTTLKPTYSLFTNGTIYTQELFNFIKQYNIKIIFSMDGNSEVFNKQRNNKFFNLVLKNLKHYITLENFKINAVFTPETINDLFNSFLFFKNIGVKELSFSPDNRTQVKWTKENLYNIKQQFLKILQYDNDKIIKAQNSLWNSNISEKYRKQEHSQNLRIYPNKKISFSSDPFLRNENKTENCSLDNFESNFKYLDNIQQQDFILVNTKENCQCCISKFLCPQPKENSQLTSEALCAMRVAFLISERLENQC